MRFSFCILRTAKVQISLCIRENFLRTAFLDIFRSLHYFCKKTMNVLIRLREHRLIPVSITDMRYEPLFSRMENSEVPCLIRIPLENWKYWKYAIFCLGILSWFMPYFFTYTMFQWFSACFFFFFCLFVFFVCFVVVCFCFVFCLFVFFFSNYTTSSKYDKLNILT